MRLIVFGASRGVGRQTTEQAATKGYEVSAFVRDASAFSENAGGINVIVGDATDEAHVERAVTGHDAVLCTLGASTRGATTLYSTAARNLVVAMQEKGVSRLIFLSNFGVLAERSLHPLTALLTATARLALRGTLSDHRAALETLKSCSLDWTAVRPMALTNGPQKDSYRVSETGLPAGGTRISRADVASFMLQQINSDRFSRCVPGLAY